MKVTISVDRQDLMDAAQAKDFARPEITGRFWAVVEHGNFVDQERSYRPWTDGTWEGGLPKCGIETDGADILARWYEDELDKAAAEEWERLWAKAEAKE